MSIPKEPRQLMINLMYIVLTAMLALNVSAEILNAFLSLDNSIRESNNIVGKSNEALLQSIREQAEAYPQFKEDYEKAQEVKQYAAVFNQFVEAMKTELVEASGGFDEENHPVGKKNKDIPTRMLVAEGRGLDLQDSVLELRRKILALVKDPLERQTLEESIPLKINPVPDNSDKKDWADFTFRQMPVAAVLPILTKFQSDAQVAETSVLNYLATKISAKPVHDEYEAIIAADKSYVIRGETLNAEIFLGAYSSTTDNITVSVNGRSVPVRDGKAQFSNVVNTSGTQQLIAEIKVTDPRSGKVKTYQRKFTYEVGERSVTTAADKMNVFYMGVENPFSVSAAGVPSGEVRVTAEGVSLTKQSSGKYLVKPSRPGLAKITVSGGGLVPTTFEYRVKPIPTPTVQLGDQTTGNFKPNTFKAYNKISPVLENFDFNARCEIAGFELTRVKKNGDVFSCSNPGESYSAPTRRLVDQADYGDTYYFDKIKAKCPGDITTRNLNGLVFRIQ